MEEINIANKLKYTPEGTKLYSPLVGDCFFAGFRKGSIIVKTVRGGTCTCNAFGHMYYNGNRATAECCLFPSKEQKDWKKYESKYSFPPYEKVIGRSWDGVWECALFSYYNKGQHRYVCVGGTTYKVCLPYNVETAKLIGTTLDYNPEV